MYFASRSVVPSTPVFDTRSEPAKSTRWSLDRRTCDGAFEALQQLPIRAQWNPADALFTRYNLTKLLCALCRRVGGCVTHLTLTLTLGLGLILTLTPTPPYPNPNPNPFCDGFGGRKAPKPLKMRPLSDAPATSTHIRSPHP